MTGIVLVSVVAALANVLSAAASRVLVASHIQDLLRLFCLHDLRILMIKSIRGSRGHTLGKPSEPADISRVPNLNYLK